MVKSRPGGHSPVQKKWNITHPEIRLKGGKILGNLGRRSLICLSKRSSWAFGTESRMGGVQVVDMSTGKITCGVA